MKMVTLLKNRIGSVIVSVLAYSAVDHGFKPRSGQSIDYKICICCPPACSESRCVQVERRVKLVDLAQSGYHHHLIEMRFDPA
jgi:hypothetical protein